MREQAKGPEIKRSKDDTENVDELRKEIMRLNSRINVLDESNAQKDQETQNAESAWEHVKTIGEHEVGRLQNLVTHVTQKATAAQAEVRAVQEEKQKVILEAENNKAMMNRMAQECNNKFAQFEQWRTTAETRQAEQNVLRESAELDAQKSKRELEELMHQNANLQATMQQMSSEYHATIACTTEDTQSVALLRNAAEQYYRQLQECGVKLHQLENTCKTQQDTIARNEGAIKQRNQEYQELYRQSEGMYQQLIQTQDQLRDQERKATQHVLIVKDMSLKAIANDRRAK